MKIELLKWKDTYKGSPVFLIFFDLLQNIDKRQNSNTMKGYVFNGNGTIKDCIKIPTVNIMEWYCSDLNRTKYINFPQNFIELSDSL